MVIIAIVLNGKTTACCEPVQKPIPSFGRAMGADPRRMRVIGVDAKAAPLLGRQLLCTGERGAKRMQMASDLRAAIPLHSSAREG